MAIAWQILAFRFVQVPVIGPACRKAATVKKPGQIECSADIVGHAERRPPGWNTRIGDEMGVGEIKNAVACQCSDNYPKIALEPGDSGECKHDEHCRFKAQCMGGAPHSGKQFVSRSDHDCHGGIERTITLEA